MMRLISIAALSLLQPPPEDAPEPFDEIVVTGRRANSVPYAQPVEFFREHCFDPQRRSGQFLAPGPDDEAWRPLDAEVREQLGIADPATTLAGLVDHVLGHTLVLRIERLAGDGGLVEHRCSLTIIGGTAHERLQQGMAGLFRGPGTQRHIGHVAGSPRLPGWRQHAWTAMPQRRSASWRDASVDLRRPGGSFIVVTDPSFYDQHSYVVGELKTRLGQRPPISILSLAHTRRERAP